MRFPILTFTHDLTQKDSDPQKFKIKELPASFVIPFFLYLIKSFILDLSSLSPVNRKKSEREISIRKTFDANIQ